jgi:DNA-binding HxlR family transcriptional regulator
VEYSLTAFGATLRPALNEMAGWAKRHHRRFGATLGAPRYVKR